MATKNLFRSVLEAGKRGYAQFEKHEYDRELRQANRRVSHRARQAGLDYDDLGKIEPTRRPYGKRRGQDDKLNPLRRFLLSRVGRPFAEVRSELTRREDQRAVRGWHLLRYSGQTEVGHLWQYVHYCYEWPHDCSNRRYSYRYAYSSLEQIHEGEFFVGHDGILRYGGDRLSYYRRNHPKNKSKKKSPKNQLHITDEDRSSFKRMVWDHKIENLGPRSIYWLRPVVDKETGKIRYTRRRELTRIEKLLYRDEGGRDSKNTIAWGSPSP